MRRTTLKSLCYGLTSFAGLAIAARLQEFFGMKESPRIGNGTPLLIELLAPNMRPVQTTTDLAGCWQHLYPEVRCQLSRRYPKHSWPEDPINAAPPARRWETLGSYIWFCK